MTGGEVFASFVKRFEGKLWFLRIIVGPGPSDTILKNLSRFQKNLATETLVPSQL